MAIVEDVGENDDKVCFYSRVFGNNRVVIIDKEKYTLSETETTFVLTVKSLTKQQ